MSARRITPWMMGQHSSCIHKSLLGLSQGMLAVAKVLVGETGLVLVELDEPLVVFWLSASSTTRWPCVRLSQPRALSVHEQLGVDLVEELQPAADLHELALPAADVVIVVCRC